jgi:hypothetical protein
VSGPIDDYLTRLARRLPAGARRELILEEVAGHLHEAADEQRALGLCQVEAERAAVSAFGSARLVARGLARRRPRWAARVLLAAASLCVAGLALADDLASPPVIGLKGSAIGVPLTGARGNFSEALVQLDPRTLRELPGTKVATHASGFLPITTSPDGMRLAIADPLSGQVSFVTVSPLRAERTIQVVPAARRGRCIVEPDSWHCPVPPPRRDGHALRVSAAGWLDHERYAALEQYQGPPYASRVRWRAVVVLDPGQPKPVARQRVPLRGTILSSASGGGKLLVVACRSGHASLLITDGTSRPVVRALAGGCRGSARPAVAVSPDGTQAAVISGDGSVDLVDLAAARVAHLLVPSAPGPLDARRANPTSTLLALGAAWVSPGACWRTCPWHEIVVTGLAERTRGGRNQWLSTRGLGVALVDATHGTARLLAREGSNALVTLAGQVLVAGWARTHRDGTGVTAFSSSGQRLWHREGTRLETPFVVGQRVFAGHPVKRHSLVSVYSLASGRFLQTLYWPGDGSRPAPISGAIFPVGT